VFGVAPTRGFWRGGKIFWMLLLYHFSPPGGEEIVEDYSKRRCAPNKFFWATTTWWSFRRGGAKYLTEYGSDPEKGSGDSPYSSRGRLGEKAFMKYTNGVFL